MMSRRAVLAASMTGVGTALTGCATSSSPSSPGAGSTSPHQPPLGRVCHAKAQLSALERSFGGRLGVYAVDTGTAVGHRADQRFLMCSTHKVLAVAAVLRRSEHHPGLMDRRIHYDSAQLLDYAPVTSQHVADGMTVAGLCAAAITRSDNTAANLLVRLVGGPKAVTAFVRALGDPITRLEPQVNVGASGDDRDTTTPAHMAADLHALILGERLQMASSNRLAGWLKNNTTGDRSIRAGIPAGWGIGDKTGSGAHGEVNDIAVVRPPHHAPLIITVYTAPDDPNSTAGYHTVAAAARIVTDALVPTP